MSEPKEKIVYAGARIPESLHRKFMSLLKLKGIKWQDLCLKWIEDYVAKHWKGSDKG